MCAWLVPNFLRRLSEVVWPPAAEARTDEPDGCIPSSRFQGGHAKLRLRLRVSDPATGAAGDKRPQRGSSPDRPTELTPSPTEQSEQKDRLQPGSEPPSSISQTPAETRHPHHVEETENKHAHPASRSISWNTIRTSLKPHRTEKTRTTRRRACGDHWSSQRRWRYDRRKARKSSAPARLNIGVLNIQSANREKLSNALYELEENRFDLMVITETWFKTGKSVDVPDGYRLIRKDRQDDGKKGGGVAILTKSRVRVKKIKLRSSRHPKSKLDSLWLSLKKDNSSVFLAAVYRPPDHKLSALEADFDHLEAQLQEIRIRYSERPLLICGDLNCDLLKENHWAPKKQLNELKSAYKMSQHIRERTHTSGSLLDVVLASRQVVVNEYITKNVYASFSTPHRMVGVKLQVARSRPKPGDSKSRLDEETVSELQRTLSHSDWLSVTDADTVEEKWESFLNILFQNLLRCSTERNQAGNRKSTPSAFSSGDGLLEPKCEPEHCAFVYPDGDGCAKESRHVFTLSPIPIGELREVVRQIRGCSSPDADGLTLGILKAVLDSAGEVLLHIVNSSLLRTEVPQSWKSFSLRLCRGRPEGRVRWRNPVVHAPVMRRVMESIVHRQLVDYVSDNRLLSDAQHGCRRHHSQETALVAISDHILEATDQSQVSLLCRLKLDTSAVQLPKLFAGLREIGVDTSWFSSYLGGDAERLSGPISRTQAVEKVPRDVGSSTTSPFWTLLCCILFDGLSEACGKERTPRSIRAANFQHEDTVVVVVSGKKQEMNALKQCMENQLEALLTWMDQHCIQMKAGSLAAILLGSQKNLSSVKKPVEVRCRGLDVNTCQEMKILGVVFDKTLSWEAQCASLHAECLAKLTSLTSNAPERTQTRDTRKRVESLLCRASGCISVYGNGTKKNANRMQKIINFSKKVIKKNVSHTDARDGRKALQAMENWPSVETLVADRTRRLADKILSTGEPRGLRKQFVRTRDYRGNSRTTRQDDLFHLPKPRTGAGKRRFVYRAAKMLNEASTH